MTLSKLLNTIKRMRADYEYILEELYNGERSPEIHRTIHDIKSRIDVLNDLLAAAGYNEDYDAIDDDLDDMDLWEELK